MLFRLMACAFAITTAAHGATITAGYLRLYGVEDLFSRGYGRSIYVDMISDPSNFQLEGGTADTTSVAPGSVSGGQAFAATTVDLARATANLDQLIYSQPIGGSGVSVRSEGLLFFTSTPVILPVLVPPPAGYTTFQLAPTPFTMTGNLQLTDRFNPGIVILNEAFTGSGMVTMQGAVGQGGSGPIYWIWDARFDFSVPEPSSGILAGIGLLAAGTLSRLRKTV